MTNVSRLARREVQEHRRSINGITAEAPRYVVVDPAGTKEWVVDVYLGPLDRGSPSIARSCPIAPLAHELITDVRQPVELERNAQGKLTVVGKSKRIPAGTQTPEGSILDPNYQEIHPNLADLGLLFISDMDYRRTPWGEKAWGEFAWGEITITDAFGAVVAGPEVDPEDVPALLSPTPSRPVTTRHTKIARIPWGSRAWGTWPWGGHEQTTIELVE